MTFVCVFSFCFCQALLGQRCQSQHISDFPSSIRASQWGQQYKYPRHSAEQLLPLLYLFFSVWTLWCVIIGEIAKSVTEKKSGQHHCQEFPWWAICLETVEPHGNWYPSRELQYQTSMSNHSTGAVQANKIMLGCPKWKLCTLIKLWNSSVHLQSKSQCIFIFILRGEKKKKTGKFQKLG